MSAWIRKSVALISSVVTAAAMSLVAVVVAPSASAAQSGPWTIRSTTFNASQSGLAAQWVANGWYHTGLGYGETHVVAGSSTVMSYHVTDGLGAPATGVTVSFIIGKTYSNSNAKVNVGGVSSTGAQAIATGVTDSNGDVSFTLVNTDTTITGKVFTQTDAYVANSNTDTVDIIDVIFDASSSPAPSGSASASSSASSSSTSYACSAGSVNECGLVTNLAVSSGGVAQTLSGSAVTVTAGQSVTFTYGPNAASANKLLDVALFGASAGLSWTRTGCSDANTVHCLMTLNSSGTGSFTMSFTGNSAGASFKYKITGEAGYSSPFVTATFAGGSSPSPTGTSTATSTATPTPTPASLKVTLASADAASSLFKDVSGVPTPIGSTWYPGNAPANNYVKYVEAGSTLTLHYNVTDTAGTSVGAGTVVTLTAAKSGGIANFTGSLTATTDSSGVATFTLINTNTNSSSEYRRADMSVWSDVPVGTTEYKFDLTPSVAGRTVTVADLVWTHIVSTEMATSTPTPTATGTATATPTSNGCSGATPFIANEPFVNLTVTGNGTKTGSVLNEDNTELTFQYVDVTKACKTIQVNLYDPSSGLELNTATAANSSTACAAGPWTPAASTVHSCYIILDSTGTATFHVAVSGTMTGASIKYSLAGPEWDSAASGNFGTVTYAGGSTPTATSTATPSPTSTMPVNVKLTAEDAATMFTVGNAWWQENSASNSYVKYVPAGTSLTLHYVVTNSSGSPIPDTAVTLTPTAKGAATFTGTTTGTTDANGAVTFTVTNTNADGTTESAREDYALWSNPSAGEVEMDFLPTVTGATSYIGRDRVWTHIVPSTAVIPTPSDTPTPTPTATATPTPTATETVTGVASITLDDADKGVLTIGNTWWRENANSNSIVKYVVAGSTLTLHYTVKDASGAVVPGVQVTLFKALTATYTGSLVGTTDAEGRVVFTLTNTNTDANAESFRSDLTLWSDSTNGVVEGDFHPYITSAGTGACYSTGNGACGRDRVWTHVVASTITAVPTPTTSPIFVSFGEGDTVGTAAASQTFGGGAAASVATSPRGDKALKFVKGAGDIWSGLNFILNGSNKLTGTGKSIVTFDYYSPDSVNSPLEVKLMGTGGNPWVRYAVDAVPGWNSISIDFSSVTSSQYGNNAAWSDATVYKTLVIFPDFTDATGMAEHVTNAGQAYYIDNVSVNGGTSANGVSDPTPTPTPTSTPTPTPTYSVPGAPTAVAIKAASATSALISWTAPVSNGGTAITGYTYTLKNNGVAVAGKSATISGTSATITGLVSSGKYSVSVTADNTVGSSSAASSFGTISPSATAAKAPGAPTLVKTVWVASAYDQATVYWTAPSLNNNASLQSYTVVVKKAGVTVDTISVLPSATVTVGTASFPGVVVTDLLLGQAYTFVVSAVNSVGATAAAATAALTPAIAPGAPTLVSVTGGSLKATVVWTAPASTGGSVITGYTVSCVGGGLTKTGAGTATATSAAVTKLVNGTTYTCSVTAKNAKGTSVASSTQTVTPATIPGTPTAATGVAGNGQVTVNWTANTVTGGAALTGFTITVKAGATVVKTVSAEAADRSAVITELNNGTAYTFSVVATNSVGNSVAKVSTAVTPATTPGVPTIGTTLQTSSTTSLTAKWTAPTSTGGSAITGYEVKVFKDGSWVKTMTATASATSLVVTGLTTKTAYTFTVAAKNLKGTGTASAASTAVSTK